MIWASAWRIGSAETLTKPVNGVSKSRIIAMPPETASAHRHRTVSAVALVGANNPKLAKTMASQKISRMRCRDLARAMDAARLAGLAVGGSRARDDRVRLPHIAMVSTLAAG